MASAAARTPTGRRSGLTGPVLPAASGGVLVAFIPRSFFGATSAGCVPARKDPGSSRFNRSNGCFRVQRRCQRRAPWHCWGFPPPGDGRGDATRVAWHFAPPRGNLRPGSGHRRLRGTAPTSSQGAGHEPTRTATRSACRAEPSNSRRDRRDGYAATAATGTPADRRIAEGIREEEALATGRPHAVIGVQATIGGLNSRATGGGLDEDRVVPVDTPTARLEHDEPIVRRPVRRAALQCVELVEPEILGRRIADRLEPDLVVGVVVLLSGKRE